MSMSTSMDFLPSLSLATSFFEWFGCCGVPLMNSSAQRIKLLSLCSLEILRSVISFRVIAGICRSMGWQT